MQIENKPVLTQANKPPGGDNPRTGAFHFMKTLLELLWSISFARKGNCMKKEFIKHHDDGSLWAKGATVEDVPDGYWEWFRKDGSKMRSGYFQSGKQTGQWTTYDKDGVTVKVTDFDTKTKQSKSALG